MNTTIMLVPGHGLDPIPQIREEAVIKHSTVFVRWESVPAPVRDRARFVLLDTLGAALAGRDEAATVQVRSLFPPSRSLSALETSVLLGVAAQAADLDETNLRAKCHIAASVVPAIVSTALAEGAAGADVMAALVSGYEFAAALGEAVAPEHGLRGWHPSATMGAFGAAVAAGRLLRLDEEAMGRAVAIASTQASGVKSVFGGTAKPLNFGKAAQAGVMAASLARAGMTAARDPLTAANGFFAAAGTPLHQGATTSRYRLLENHFKFLPFCIETHAAVLSAAAVREKLGGPPDRLRVTLAPSARVMVDRPQAHCIEEARFSVQYAIARATQEIPPTALPEPFDPSLLASMQGITVEEGEELGHLSARVTGIRRGAAQTAMTDLGPTGSFDPDEIVRKFDLLAEPVLGVKIGPVRDGILGLDRSGDVSEILADVVRHVTLREVA